MIHPNGGKTIKRRPPRTIFFLAVGVESGNLNALLHVSVVGKLFVILNSLIRITSLPM